MWKVQDGTDRRMERKVRTKEGREKAGIGEEDFKTMQIEEIERGKEE